MIGKPSPCCDAPMVAFISLNIKMCWKCRKEYQWDLKPGQKPLFKRSPD